jgi:hypothetical protein
MRHVFTHAPSTWKRRLPFKDHMELSEAFAKELNLARPYPGHFHLVQSDGSSMSFENMAELEERLQGLRAKDVERVGVNLRRMGAKPGLQFFCDTSHTPTTQLSLSGPDETVVRGLQARFKSMIDRRFEDLDEQAAAVPQAPSGGINIGSFGALGVLSGGQAATSVEAPGTASSGAPPASSGGDDGAVRPWWNHPWVIAVVGGTLAIVLGAIVLRFVL